LTPRSHGIDGVVAVDATVAVKAIWERYAAIESSSAAGQSFQRIIVRHAEGAK
jgi:hypothetical protein